MKDKLVKIINNYGIANQLKKFNEECFELEEAIIEYENFYKYTGKAISWFNMSPEHIAEEIADVMVMLKQFQYYYGIQDKEIIDIMKYKINRQLERIEKESK